MEHMRSVARGLENKIMELQQKLDEKVTVFSMSFAEIGCVLRTAVLRNSVSLYLSVAGSVLPLICYVTVIIVKRIGNIMINA